MPNTGAGPGENNRTRSPSVKFLSHSTWDESLIDQGQGGRPHWNTYILPLSVAPAAVGRGSFLTWWCQRPERNQPQSPQIYLGDATNSRKASSKETLGRQGEPLGPWAVPALDHMGRSWPGKLGAGTAGWPGSGGPEETQAACSSLSPSPWEQKARPGSSWEPPA